MIRRVLIANRGEIAIRLARGARAVGISPVGIASEADRHSLHCRSMDDSLIIGPAPAAQSYLDPERIIHAARALNADAVHPGYGFLSERADFAAALEAAGLIFIGPPTRALELAGDKRLARKLARDIAIPTLEGYDAENQDPVQLHAAAQTLGFPLLIKACNGGGGRGQRVVHRSEEFPEQLAAAKREALAAFGDDKVILERYLENPRHIEFQILADAHGTIVHLGERDCSLQRRRQKVIEEAPAPHFPPALRAAMGDAAIAFARAAAYRNAGTVEFLLEKTGQFSFLEMNARLQVEHPITEAITGIDLVAWQFRIAAGERLPSSFQHIEPRGWAFEARLCAEDPAHDLVPSSGTISLWQPPGEDIRLDSGVEAGSVVPLDYDSLLAKLIAWDETREAALARLTRSLHELRVEGITTNQEFLLELVAQPQVQTGTTATTWLDTYYQQRNPQALTYPAEHLVLALAAALMLEYDWRINAVGRQIILKLHHELIAYRASFLRGSWHLERQDAVLQALRNSVDEAVNLDLPRHLILSIDASPPLNARLHVNVLYQLEAVPSATPARVSGLLHVAPTQCTIHPDGKKAPFEISLRSALESFHLVKPDTRSLDQHNGQTLITSPMPGRIVRILVQAGDHIEDHQVLAILEAMKMEHRIEAPGTGVVNNVFCVEGDVIASGTTILELGPVE